MDKSVEILCCTTLMLIIIALGTIEGPVASSDARIIYNGDGTVKYMESKALNPFVPIALIELVTCVWVTEQTCSLTHLWAQSIIKVTASSWPKPLEFPAARQFSNE